MNVAEFRRGVERERLRKQIFNAEDAKNRAFMDRMVAIRHHDYTILEQEKAQ